MNVARQPAVFIGHGSPMNAIQVNDFTITLSALGRTLAANRPRAILVISAHWETSGPRVVTNDRPRTIHDFGGFPRALFEVQYPAPGAPAVARDLIKLLPEISADETWGLDHGAWSVLTHLFPNADLPTLQLSLNKNATPREHHDFAIRLRGLRDQGVLILGSGNVTHNLRRMEREVGAQALDWAREFDEMTRDALLKRDLAQLCAERPEQSELWRVAHPTLEHYLPLLYVVGVAHDDETATFPIEGFQHATLSTRAVRFG